MSGLIDRWPGIRSRCCAIGRGRKLASPAAVPARSPGADAGILFLAAVFALITLPVFEGSDAAEAPASPNARPTLILVAGAPGEPEYGSNFIRQVELWVATAARANATTVRIGFHDTADEADAIRLKKTLASQPCDSVQPLWLVFIGHGTFDGHQARFNLRGPDVTATELSDWLKPYRRPLVFINTASASAPFMPKISATNRVVITATRSGNEQNFTRFGQFLAAALADSQSDLDKDGQTSVLEAFLTASARVSEFYTTEGRLATEHALLDDNGDGLGTPADWFRGVRAVKKPQGTGSVDGARAHQMHLVLSQVEQALPSEIRAKRDALELAIFQLRESKDNLPEPEYYRELERLLAQLLDAYGSHLGTE
jgi:hypothetical protein